MARKQAGNWAVSLAACLFAGAAMAGPQLEVKPDPLDFGTMRQGEKLRKTLTVRNIGDEDLVITQARSSCAECILDKFEEKRLAPGEEFSLPVTYDASLLPSKQTAHLTFHSNDPKEPLKRSYLTIEIIAQNAKPKLAVSPAVLDVGIVPVGESVEREVEVRNEGAAPLRLTDFTMSPSVAILQKPLTDVAAGGHDSVRIRVTVKEAGILQGHLTIASNDPEQRVATVPLRGYAATREQMAGLTAGILLTPEFQGGALTALRIANTSPVPVTVTRPDGTAGVKLTVAPGESVRQELPAVPSSKSRDFGISMPSEKPDTPTGERRP